MAYQSWETVLSDIKECKRKSKKARDDGDWALALELVDRAISSLLHVLSPSLSSVDAANSIERGVAEQLADCYGMKGGIFRHAQDLDASVANYDRGYLYEECPRFGIVSSYNLLNRLISRLMLEPRSLVNGRQVAGLFLRPELEKARDIINEQINKFNRRDDPWAWGDLAVCTALLLRTPDERIWNEFFGLVPSNHAHKTTADTLEALLECDDSNALPREAITAAITRLRTEQVAG